MPSTLAEIREFVHALPLNCRQPPEDGDPLITSGLLDSLALFRLFQEVERHTGQKLDLLAIDFSDQWNSITKIAHYIDTYGTDQ